MKSRGIRKTSLRASRVLLNFLVKALNRKGRGAYAKGANEPTTEKTFSSFFDYVLMAIRSGCHDSIFDIDLSIEILKNHTCGNGFLVWKILLHCSVPLSYRRNVQVTIFR
jgi:hypothetical protein